MTAQDTTGTAAQECKVAQRPIEVIPGTKATPPHGACARCGKPAVFTFSIWRHGEATR